MMRWGSGGSAARNQGWGVPIGIAGAEMRRKRPGGRAWRAVSLPQGEALPPLVVLVSYPLKFPREFFFQIPPSSGGFFFPDAFPYTQFPQISAFSYA